MKMKYLISMELKGLRLYSQQIFVSTILVPLSYLILIILNSDVTGKELAYLVTGFGIASVVGSFFMLLTYRVSNLFQPQVFELYSTLPLKIKEAVSSLFFTYTLLIVPQLLVSVIAGMYYTGEIHLLFLPLALFITLVEIGVLSIALGITIRNPYKVQAVTSILPWIVILFSPAYYRSESFLLMINPVTHVLNLFRYSFGIESSVSIEISLVISLLILGIFFVYCTRRIKSSYMLEKLV